VRSSFLQRLVDHRHKYVSDAEGNVTLSPDFKDGHQDEHKSEHQHEHKAD
jgi:hypothetical protein